MTETTRWPAVLLATLCGVIAAMNIGKLPVALPVLRQDFGLSLVDAGWVVSAFNFLAVVMAVFFGIVGDHLGAVRFCLLGLLLSLAGTVLGLASGGLFALLVSRFCEGAGFIAIGVSAPALISAASSAADRRFALTVWSCYMPAGAGIAMLLAPLFLADGNWQALWWLVALLLGATTAVFYAMRGVYHVPASGQPAGLREFRTALAQARPWLLALVFTCYSVQFFAVTTWLPTFLREERHFSTSAISLLTAMTMVVNVAGNLCGGWLMQRRVRRGQLILVANAAMGAAAVGIFTGALGDALRYALCLVLTFVGGIVPASVLSSSAVLARTPRQIGTLQGLYIQGSNLGQFLGPPAIASLVSVSGDWRSALLVTGAAAAAGAGLGAWLRRA